MRSWTAAVIDAVGELVGRTSLSGAPVLAVASPSGEGIAELRAALLELRDRVVEEGRVGHAGRAAPGDRSGLQRQGSRVVVTGSSMAHQVGASRGGRIRRGARRPRRGLDRGGRRR